MIKRLPLLSFILLTACLHEEEPQKDDNINLFRLVGVYQFELATRTLAATSEIQTLDANAVDETYAEGSLEIGDDGKIREIISSPPSGISRSSDGQIVGFRTGATFGEGTLEISSEFCDYEMDFVYATNITIDNEGEKVEEERLTLYFEASSCDSQALPNMDFAQTTTWFKLPLNDDPNAKPRQIPYSVENRPAVPGATLGLMLAPY